MFGRSNVYAMVNAFKTRVKDARQKDRNHLCEVDFEVPLTHSLADSISPAMARDIFEPAGDDWRAKAEILEAAFDINPEVQLMEVREHPDLDSLVRIAGVTLRKIWVYRGEGGAVLLGFTATWTIGDYEREAAAMIRRLKSGVYLSFEAQEPSLLSGPEHQAVDAGPNDDGQVDGHRYPKKTKKKGGRRKPAADVDAPESAQASDGDGGEPGDDQIASGAVN